MTTASPRLTGLIFVVFGGLVLAHPAWAATPMFGCWTAMVFVADQPGELQPDEHDLMLTVTHLPGFIPFITTKDGYDFCVFYERIQADEMIPPINSGALKAVAYRLNKRDRWRKITTISNVPVSANVAAKCKNVKKKLEVGTTVRWIVKLNGMPPLDYLDMYEIEASIFTGGVGDLLEGPE